MEGKGKEIVESYGTDSDDQFEDEAPPDEGYHLSCLIHRNCHTPRNPSPSQRTNLFQTRGTIRGKVCDIIVDNGSTDNLISAKTIKKLGLETLPNPTPYSVGSRVEIQYW